MRNKLRVTATRKGFPPKVNESILGHSADKIAKSIPNITSLQAYMLKTNGKVELVEDGCDVLIEIIPVGDKERIQVSEPATTDKEEKMLERIKRGADKIKKRFATSSIKSRFK